MPGGAFINYVWHRALDVRLVAPRPPTGTLVSAGRIVLQAIMPNLVGNPCGNPCGNQ
jgi:hypothetical protein